ncbi:MAG: hypothetical protein IJU70_11715, partial [Lentisphaeria bacterium]|nr:hypothetical protein [Lentisphaeria bacterium]
PADVFMPCRTDTRNTTGHRKEKTKNMSYTILIFRNEIKDDAAFSEKKHLQDSTIVRRMEK